MQVGVLLKLVFPKALFQTMIETVFFQVTGVVICLSAAVLAGTGVGSVNSPYDKKHVG